MSKTEKYVNPEKIVIYGHSYCPGARRLRKALEEKQIDFEWRDVKEGDPRFQGELKELARGYLSVPTVILPDGTLMVEPYVGDVLQKINQ